MTERQPVSHQLTEQDVEDSLQRFFAAEVPSEFRSEEPPVQTTFLRSVATGMPVTPKESRQLAGYMAVAVSTICCLLVILLSPGPEETTDQPTFSDHSVSPDMTTEEFVPVEERDHLRYSNLANGEDETEASENSSDPLPELEIEIFPEKTKSQE